MNIEELQKEQEAALWQDEKETISKPRILEAPYDLSSEAIENQEELQNRFLAGPEPAPKFITEEAIYQAIEAVKQIHELTNAVVAIVNLQRDVDRLNDNLARVFKELGHEHTWNKIVRD